jgi:hypothetical protein
MFKAAAKVFNFRREQFTIIVEFGAGSEKAGLDGGYISSKQSEN